jgi:hypothetical protein
MRADLGFVGWRWEKASDGYFGQRRGKGKERKCRGPSLWGRDSEGDGDGEGRCEEMFWERGEKIQFLTYVFDKFSKKNKNSKKTTKTQKNSFLIYLHRF